MFSQIVMNSARIVMTSYPNEGRDLKRLIVAILKQDLAACVQRINYVKAYYIWEGAIQKTEEKILLIKTTTEKVDKLIEFLKKQHPYSLPEIMTLHPDEVDASYLAWLSQDHPIHAEKKQKGDHKKDQESKKKDHNAKKHPHEDKKDHPKQDK